MSKKRWGVSLILGGLALGLVACSGGFRLPGGQRLQQQPGTALLERKSGRIAYVGTDGNIYVTDQGGLSQTPLTSDALLTDDFYHVYHLPTWSPDGSEVAFVGESGTLDSVADTVLYTVPREGGVLTEAYNINEGRILFPYWSPNGEHVSFLSNQGQSRYELQTVSPDGSDHSSVLGSRTPLYQSWAPDSESVLVHSDGELTNASDSVLSAIRLGAAESAEDTLPYQPGEFQAPAWSPDGSQLLFATSGSDGVDSLVVADADGQNPRVVTEYEGRIAFAWSPDGRYVAYITSNPDARIALATGPFGILGQLNLYDLQQNEAVEILEEEPVLAFFWSPNSKRLAYYVPRVVTDEDTGDQSVVLSMKIAVARTGEVYELFRFEPPFEFMQMLLFFDQYQRSATVWSPDSQNVVFATVEGDASIIAIMHASGSIDPRGIAEGTMAFWSWK